MKAKAHAKKENKENIPLKKEEIKPVELEDPETVIAEEEKGGGDDMADEEGIMSDEAGLSEEDIDPFGDKWEE